MKIATYLPEKIIDNAEFAELGWSPEQIFDKTGIRQRRVAGDGEYAMDLAQKACEKLFGKFEIDRGEIDYLVYCTQSPDTSIPNTSSVLHERLGLPQNIGCLDFNQGCTGYIYGLSIAKGMLLTGQAKNLLLVTAETYSKYIAEDDRTNRTIFGDAASASLLDAGDAEKIGDFVFGSDGRGAKNLCVKGSGLRKELFDGEDGRLFMNGPEIFNFTLRSVPAAIETLLEKSGLHAEDIDHFIFHQANGFMLEHLRKKMKIPAEKFPMYLEHVGNTVSSTIPIVMEHLTEIRAIKENQRIVLVGFGVGYSWGAVVLYIAG